MCVFRSCNVHRRSFGEGSVVWGASVCGSEGAAPQHAHQLVCGRQGDTPYSASDGECVSILPMAHGPMAHAQLRTSSLLARTCIWARLLPQQAFNRKQQVGQ